MNATFKLRPATDHDYAFMQELYGYSREEELKMVDWPDEQKRAFIGQQFAAQTQHYATYYPTVERLIVERDGLPIGRLYVDRWTSEIRLVDIALIPEARNGGIGSSLLAQVLEEGRAAGKPVTIHVELYNPALRLYERLGFKPVDTNGVYLLMKWTPEDAEIGRLPPSPSA